MKKTYDRIGRAGSCLLILAILMSLLSVSIFAVGGFTDVRDGDWFAEPVLWAVDDGITNGTTALTFSPNDTCTRAQILTFLWRAAGEPTPLMYCPFYDVAADAYYCEPAAWAYENGLVEGMLFEGSAPCTRADVVTYLWKLSGSPYAAPAAFADVPAYASYSQAVSWAVGNAITNGTGNGLFSPQNTCTRGQIVTFLYRAFVENEAQTAAPSWEAPASGGITQSYASEILQGLLSTYPEGTWWDIETSYTSTVLNMTYSGCAGFALYCSDLIFGDLPITEVHSDFDRIKVGDMVRDESGRHTVMVLEKQTDSIIVVEGNYNDTVHWYRQMYRTDPEFYNFTVTTRYP
ncbi:MAG: S-layer homology domain-containing protein [Oscillospiraceae bacterium]|nr:S-layer homology domain-containing protein [Oscillospiraceae bacterium]